MSSKVTYRQQYTRCGKQRCRKCREGAGHGPYWYAYWSENGRTISKYIGMHRPPDTEATNQPETQSPPFHQDTIGDQAVLPGTSQPVLRIYLLGQFRVERRTGNEWQPVTNRTWQRRRARALLGCLLSSPGRRMGREQVMEALWPELDIETATNRLNGAVHELRQILEPEISRPAASSMLRLQ
ncbi:MAG: winged helix-turn-helix domain-containing protein, partial [Ktedonobacteraceae bacterium]|nr:winged helix-turn-helix domain-containing protein [Ktedonobacteraceae bacterium]